MKQIITKISIIFIVLIFTTCIILGKVNFESNVNKQINNTAKEVNTNVQDKNISIDINDIINTLCSDKFEGRLAGTKGNDYTMRYMSDLFEELELDFEFKNSYFHEFSIETKTYKNVIGKIPGNNSNDAVIISAHFDHIGINNGEIRRGALDNASGVSALLKIAYTLKEASEKKRFDFDIIIAAFNAEELALAGSRAFVKDIKIQYNKLYNINIDCVGSKNGGNLALKNISKVKDSEKLYKGIKSVMEKHKIEFSDTAVSEEAFRAGAGIGDHHSFEEAGIPNIYIGQEGIKPLVHKVTDIPEFLNYDKIEKTSNAISDFIETNGSNIFE